jgi:hypothetical protein
MQGTRLRGVKKIAIGIVALAIAAIAFAMLKMNNMTAYGVGWGIPGAVVLVGLIELIGGVPFMQVSSKWDSLQGWQRGVLGTLIVVVTPLAILGLFIAIITVAG